MAASSRKRERPVSKENEPQQQDATGKPKPIDNDEEAEELMLSEIADNEDDLSDSEESIYSGLGDEEGTASDDSDDEESDDKLDSEDEDQISERGPGTSGAPVPKPTVNEYEFDSSDEEDIRNTVGNVPKEWYADYPHIGYDLSGEKILRPATGDELDKLIEQSENPDYWRTVRDPQTGQNVVLSREDCAIISRLRQGKFADGLTDPFQEWLEFFSNEPELHPLSNRPEDKRSFIPSKWEKLKVGRMVHSMKMGWMKPPSQVKKEKEEQKDEMKTYDLWANEDEMVTKMRFHIPAPKMVLPGHSESYNPPPEYLFTAEERLKWLATEPEDRRQNFMPQRFNNMREIPGYNRYINERFERCMDLYLCPRQQKMRMNVNPEDLIPKLPQPKDLQPFPTTQAIVYTGHTDLVRKISIDPSGQWFISGSDDLTAKLWEVQTGRCMKTIKFTEKIKSVAWCPNSSLSLAAIASGRSVYIINPMLGDKLVVTRTDELLIEGVELSTTSTHAEWIEHGTETSEYTDQNWRVQIKHKKIVMQVSWHAKGDYFAATLEDGGNQSVLIHQLTKRRSQCPFSRSKGIVQCTLFHPNKPFLFVATQRYVRVYNLLKQELTRKLQANCKWISSMAIHPGGDNLVTGSYDCRLHWFDMDLSTKPYQTLKHQTKAIRSVDIHKKYPLFASTSDDGSVVVCHGMVYNDLMQNPLIVPVKVLRGHKKTNELSAIDCQFHPTQPWVLSSGADGNIILFS